MAHLTLFLLLLGALLLLAAVVSASEAACEGKGFDQTQCAAVGCCDWDEGQCWGGDGDCDGGGAQTVTTASAAFDASTGYGTGICLTANSACPAGETSTCPSAAKVKGMSSLMYACAHPWKYHITVLTGHAVPPSPPTTM